MMRFIFYHNTKNRLAVFCIMYVNKLTWVDSDHLFNGFQPFIKAESTLLHICNGTL